MKKSILLTLTWCCAYLSSVPQSTTCNAEFAYQISGQKVIFMSVDSVGVKHSWDFGDGSPLLQTEKPVVEHIYQNPGEYTIKHYVSRTNSNCRATTTKVIKLEDYCKAYFEFYRIASAAVNSPFTYQFKNGSQSFTNIKEFYWKFSDGTTSSLENPIHSFPGPGNYEVCLNIKSRSGCENTYCATVLVIDSCRIDIRWRYENIASDPFTIHFFNETIVPSAGAVYKWSFGDGKFSDEKNPVHKYEAAGSYSVCLKVFISNTCVKELCKTVVVGTPCSLQAKFEYKIDPVHSNKVYFYNRTEPGSNAVHFKWMFGDGTTSNDVNPVHVYDRPGTYEVCLIAESPNGCRSEYCQKVEIRPVICNLEPKFTWKPDEQNPNRIHFKNLTIVSSTAVKFTWKFGDGTTSNEVNPVHIYDKAGEYEVCLVAEFSNLCRKVTCQKVIVGSCDVQARFEWKNDDSEWNKVWFSNTSHPVSNIWRTYWYYGDGTTSQDFNSFHSYASSGKYYVCLKVIGLDGCISSYCDSVVVRGECLNRSDFKYERATANVLEYKFKPEHINQNWKYHWSFGDGSTSTQIFPVHKFAKEGTYKVCLIVSTSATCRTTTCKEIKVGAECETLRIKFEYRRHPNHPNRITFQAVSNEALVKQRWVITKSNGTPVIFEAFNPTYIFQDTGWYKVCLYGKTNIGCEKSYCEGIYIEKVGSPGGLSPITVYPNPALNTIRLDLKLDNRATININVLDAAGGNKLRLNVVGHTGNNVITLPVEKLSNGLYWVELRFNGLVHWAKFQKS